MTGLLFSGQGSQRAGMGAPWRDANADAWRIVNTISEISGQDVAALLIDADDDTLRRTDLAQLSTFALEMVVVEHVRDRAEWPEVVACAGHSLGEYSALVAADVLDLEAATRLVAARGAAMLDAARAEPGTMVAVVGAGADEETVERVVAVLRSQLRARVWIANLNAPGQIVLSGDAVGIERASAAMVEGGVGKVLSLPVGGAFHSPLMDSARIPLDAALARVPFSDARVPVVANVDAEPHTRADDWPDLLSRQLTAPVRWHDVIQTMVSELGCASFLEIGPGNTLSNMVKRIDRGVPCSVVTPDVTRPARPAPRELRQGAS